MSCSVSMMQIVNKSLHLTEVHSDITVNRTVDGSEILHQLIGRSFIRLFTRLSTSKWLGMEFLNHQQYASCFKSTTKILNKSSG